MSIPNEPPILTPPAPFPTPTKETMSSRFTLSLRWLVNRTYNVFGHRRILEAIRDNAEAAWPTVERIWSGAATVFITVAGPKAKLQFERRLAQEMGHAEKGA